MLLFEREYKLFNLSSFNFRDDYVKIMENNIQPSKRHNFAKRNWSEIEYSDVAYDYKSVTHYDMYGASKQRVSIMSTVFFSSKMYGSHDWLTYPV